MALDSVTSFLRLKDVTNTCKRMRHQLLVGIIQCNGGKLEEVEDFKCVIVVYCGSAFLREFVVKLYEDKSFALRARDLIFCTTDLQTVNYYSTIHC